MVLVEVSGSNSCMQPGGGTGISCLSMLPEAKPIAMADLFEAYLTVIKIQTILGRKDSPNSRQETLVQALAEAWGQLDGVVAAH